MKLKYLKTIASFLRKIRRCSCLSISALILLLSLTAPLSFAEETYYPSPVIFVHGVDPGSPSSWDTAISQLRKYFYNSDGSSKYFDYGYGYLIALDYTSQNNGDIPSIARTALKSKIDQIKSKLPYAKVNIVAHSMGGLVTRSLLSQSPSYQYSIDKVIFIGTSHLGAPAASALWILNKLNKTTLNELVTKYSRFYSLSAFTGFRFKPVDYSPYMFSAVASKLLELKVSIVSLLDVDKDYPFFPDPEGMALEQLRIPAEVRYNSTIIGVADFEVIREDISIGHSGGETFLGQGNLAVPWSYKTIRGVNYGWGKPLAWGMNFLLDPFSNNFTFPPGQSLSDAANSGDGIVTRASQEGIGAANYTISAFHTQEPEVCSDNILKIIDGEAPIIESVRAVPVDWQKAPYWMLAMGGDTESADFPSYDKWGEPKDEYYVIVKVKDYFLADIAVESVTLDGEDVALPSSFRYSKPYNAYADRGFLRSRKDAAALYRGFNGTLACLELKPGEFWLKLDLADKKRFSVKVRNVVGLSAEKVVEISSPEASFIWEPYIEGQYYWGAGAISPFAIDVPPINLWYEENTPEQLTLSLKVTKSPYSNIRCSAFIVGHQEKVIRKLITQKNVDFAYGGYFEPVAIWDGKDGNGSYDYSPLVFGYITPIYFVVSDVLVESADNPYDNLLPLIVRYAAPIVLGK